MCGCDSRNSPIDGSSVKPCTPLPVEYTSMVLDPYRTYPAATWRAARLQAVLERSRPALGCDAAVDRENGPDRDIDVDVARSVERIEEQHVLPHRQAGRHGDRLLVLLGGQHAGPAGVLHALERTVSLANTSSFCCSSPWTLVVPISPRMSDEAGPAHVARNDLGGETDIVQQVRQLARGFRELALLLDDESLNRDDGIRVGHGGRRW